MLEAEMTQMKADTGTYNVGCYTMLQPSTTFVGSKAVSQKSQPTLLLPKMLLPALPYNICWSNVVHLLFDTTFYLTKL